MRKLEQYQPEKQKKGEQTRLISVIVTVYNIREYLPKAVDSILFSTYQNLEVLLIDDGSTDGSERICDEYAKKDGRVRVVHQKNGGAYSARNTGLLEAKGDYLTFVMEENAQPDKMSIYWKAIEHPAAFEIQLSSGGGQFLTVYKGEIKEAEKLSTYSFPKTIASDVRIAITSGKASISEVKLDNIKH